MNSRSGLPPVNEQIEIAREGDVPARWGLATTYGVSREAVEILYLDDDSRVLDGLAGNYGVHPAVLSALASKSEELRAVVALNPFAPPDLKLPIPLIHHASLAITRFLEDVGATVEQREALMTAYTAAVQAEDEAVSLREAWDEISTMRG